MNSQYFDHFNISNYSSSADYISTKTGRGTFDLPKRERSEHADHLNRRLKDIWTKSKNNKKEREAISIPTKDGMYLEFVSSNGFELKTKSLENLSTGIRLLNIRKRTTAESNIQTLATIYIPKGKENTFLKKIESYKSEDTEKGNPKNKKLIESINDIKIAILESMWTDPLDMMPGSEFKWIEVWLRIENKESTEVDNFKALLDKLEIKYKAGKIIFPERAIVLIHAHNDTLKEIMEIWPRVAEFRIGQQATSFWTHESNKEQAEWAVDLLNRLVLKDSKINICLLDTGVNNGHVLLSQLLNDKHCLTVKSEWGVTDHEERSGHGTLMAGIAAYNEIESLLNTNEEIEITHKLSSVKVIPPKNQDPTPVEHWGDIIKQAISRIEIISPNSLNIFCLSITSITDVDRGHPSSWSGAIDNECFGIDETKRLIIVSGGNINKLNEWQNYPVSNKTYSIENPGQSWNAITVGAYTEKVLLPINYDDYSPLAEYGTLLPYSSTSLIWQQKSWPYKPDVVFEGGNILIHPDGTLNDGFDDYSLLSTSKNSTLKQFDTINATSAASAKCAHFAAKLVDKYPELWPETIRALIIHSADWTNEMCRQFDLDLKRKKDVKELLRIFGYGKPNLSKALNTLNNSLTYISEREIQPFQKNGSKHSMKEMHFYEIPWPKQTLLDLAELEVTLKVTLSYYVEPGPGEIGWKNKYRYRSHGLSFDINTPQEDADTFIKRINKAARETGENTITSGNSDRWTIGNNGRTLGSIHKDIWVGTAAEISTCNLIGIFPTIGWWRERSHLNKCDSVCRYSILISLDTPLQEIDLYTPVLNKIKVPIKIKV